MLCNQGHQFRPWDHQVQFVQKLTLALGDQLESGVGKAHLLHSSNVSIQAVSRLTFVRLSLAVNEVQMKDINN